jgi:AraC-like DNA-binding protein
MSAIPLPRTPALETARLHLPKASLINCVRAVIVRDTRGVVLSDQERFNCFPATPYCSISWFVTGGVELLDFGPGDWLAKPRRPFEGKIMFAGPVSGPTVSWSPGPMHALMLMWAPDAVQALTGLDPGQFIDQFLPAEQVLDGPWLRWCERVLRAPDDLSRMALIEETLAPRWAAARPQERPGRNLVDDWSANLALRAATSGLGRSLRQVERRIKHWTGMPLRELRGLGRAERVFFESLMAHERGEVDWSHLAEALGYSDQSHLCRQTRRITGFAPVELRRRIAEDEGFWPYRVWGYSENPRAHNAHR